MSSRSQTWAGTTTRSVHRLVTMPSTSRPGSVTNGSPTIAPCHEPICPEDIHRRHTFRAGGWRSIPGMSTGRPSHTRQGGELPAARLIPDVPMLPGGCLSHRVELPAAAEAVPRAREATSTALRLWRLPEPTETATLLVSELVTNAVTHAEHGGAAVTLLVMSSAGTVRVEVHDADPTPPKVRHPDGLDEDGRGLLLVTTLAHRWGVRPLPTGGKAVWFEITHPRPGTGAPTGSERWSATT
ncbi:MAG: ATP-binding protein [Carbonactinosporaceae bacterium]